MSDEFDADHLRPLERVTEPDPRQEAFAVLNGEGGGFRALTMADYHAAAASLALSDSVPEKVRVQFETAKNLYLYGWFVYRFLPVAEHHGLACLEYALRERYRDEIPKSYYRRKKTPDLRPLLRYAIDKGAIRNEGFEIWHHRTRVKSRMRTMVEKLEEMKARGLKEILFDENDFTVLDQDRDWDYVNVLIETLPKIRNNYAHGASTVHGGVLGTLQIVTECVNQVYQK